MENISQMSLIEVATALMEQKRTPQNIYNLIKEVLEMKGFEEDNEELKTQLYVDIIASSKFVYMGNDEWDLKLRHSLDDFDKDGSAFNSKDDEYVEEEEEEDTLEEELSDDEEDDDEEADDEDEAEDVDDVVEPKSFIDEVEIEESFDDVEDEVTDHFDEDFDEDKYNDYMDDFENMYED